MRARKENIAYEPYFSITHSIERSVFPIELSPTTQSWQQIRGGDSSRFYFDLKAVEDCLDPRNHRRIDKAYKWESTSTQIHQMSNRYYGRGDMPSILEEFLHKIIGSTKAPDDPYVETDF